MLLTTVMSQSVSCQHQVLPALLLLLLLLSCSLTSAGSGMREDIDEETWPQVLKGGRWFIKFYAPWCEACAVLAPVWQNLAASEGLPRDVHIAQVDVTRNEALAGMFLVTGLPSLYMLHDGEFWQYRGDRSLPALLRYVQMAEYTRFAPLPWYRAPDALHMRGLGRLIQGAVRLKQLHTHLVEVRGLPSALAYVVLAVLTLAIGLVAGLALVCLCDLLCARRRRTTVAASPADKATASAAGDDNSEVSASGAGAKAAAAGRPAESASGVGEEDDVGDNDSEDLLAEESSLKTATATAAGQKAVRKRAVRKAD